MSSPHESGLLSGGGVPGRSLKHKKPPGRTRHFPNVFLQHLSEIRSVIPDFEEGTDYTARELILLAEKILLEDPRPCGEDPMWLNMSMYKERLTREIQTASGTPDPSYIQGMYWRTHPDGRSFKADPESRKKNRSSFYR